MRFCAAIVFFIFFFSLTSGQGLAATVQVDEENPSWFYGILDLEADGNQFNVDLEFGPARDLYGEDGAFLDITYEQGVSIANAMVSLLNAEDIVYGYDKGVENSGGIYVLIAYDINSTNRTADVFWFDWDVYGEEGKKWSWIDVQEYGWGAYQNYARISPVPIPGALGLIFSSLAGLFCIVRKHSV